MRKEQIQICFITDNNYVIPTAVAIHSIKKNKSFDSDYHIHVIGVSLDKPNIDKLSVLRETGIEIIIENDNNDNLWFSAYDQYNYVSKSAMLKFTLAERFANLNKILYLDGDIIVQGDLTPLWSYDIDNVYAGVVKNYKPYEVFDYQKSVLHTNHQFYFNSGVMLLNLKKIRDSLSVDNFLKAKDRINTKDMDQDVLNVVFQEKVLYLPLKYNTQSKCINEMSLDELISFYGTKVHSTKDDVIRQACILHLASPYKPWLFDNVLYSTIWADLYKDLFKTEYRGRKHMDVESKKNIFKQYDIYTNNIHQNIEEDIVVIIPVTTNNTDKLYVFLDNLSNQSVKPDRIAFLCLENTSWSSLDAFTNIEIVQCSNNTDIVKSLFEDKRFAGCVKIILKENATNDIFLIEKLLQSYICNPHAVSATSCCLVGMTYQGEMTRSTYWRTDVLENVPSFSLIALDNSSILFPPNISLKKLSNKIIKDCEPYDILLFIHTILMVNNVPVIKIEAPPTLDYVFEKSRLDQFQNLLHYIDISLGNDSMEVKLYLSYLKYSKLTRKVENGEKFEKELNRVLSTKSYRMGKTATKLPKLVKSIFIKQKV